MHIPDGILPPTVCLVGYALTGGLTAFSLRRIQRYSDPQAGIPKASLLAATFFVASWVHIPIPPASVHLILNGLVGVVLGDYAFLAILVGLFFQAVLFGHGGLSTLGVNAILMGLPALLAGQIFQFRDRFSTRRRFWTGCFAFGGGAIGLILSALIFYGLLISFIPAHLDQQSEQTAITVLTVAHIFLAVIEGIFAALVVLFLERVKPELLRLQ